MIFFFIGPKTNRMMKGIVAGIKEAIRGERVYTKEQIIKMNGTVMERSAEYLASWGLRF